MSKSDRDTHRAAAPVDELVTLTSPFDTDDMPPEPEVEEVPNPIDRLSDKEKGKYHDYLRESIKAQRDAEALGQRNYSR